MDVIDGGEWRGPGLDEWLDRINTGACRIAQAGRPDETLSGGEWTLPWYRGTDGTVEPATQEKE